MHLIEMSSKITMTGPASQLLCDVAGGGHEILDNNFLSNILRKSECSHFVIILQKKLSVHFATICINSLRKIQQIHQKKKRADFVFIDHLWFEANGLLRRGEDFRLYSAIRG